MATSQWEGQFLETMTQALLHNTQQSDHPTSRIHLFLKFYQIILRPIFYELFCVDIFRYHLRLYPINYS